MYASIRKYKTDAPGIIIPIIRNEFLPMIKSIPGFISYYLISSETDSNDMTTVSIFETKDGALASGRMASDWVKNSDLLKFLIAVPEFTAGEVNASILAEVHH